MNYYVRICIAALLCMSVSSLSCMRHGQRLLTVQIESDGNVVYDGMHGVPDSTPVVEMWDVLGDVSFKATTNDNSVHDDDEKNARELEGSIVVRIKHGDDELSNASLKKLKLCSDDAGTAWTLDGAEVERIKLAAGK